MNWFHMKTALLAVGLAVITAAPAAAGVPTDQLRGAVDRVLKTLDDPSLKGEGKVADRRGAGPKIANEIFHFREIANRALARPLEPLTLPPRTHVAGPSVRPRPTPPHPLIADTQ